MPVLALSQTQIITENFDAPTDKWSVYDNGKLATSYKNGTYVMDNVEEGYMKFCGADYLVDIKSDYSLEAKVKFILGSRKSGYGLAWAYRNWNNYNVFYITNDGFASVFTKKGDDLVKIHDWKEIKKKILKQESEYNVLRVERKDGQMFFYINNTQVFTAEAGKMQANGRQQGIMMQNNMKVAIDYLNIQCREQKINLVDNANNGFKPENMGPLINTSSSDRFPVISPDGKTLFLVSDRPGGFGATDAWQAVHEQGEWKKAENCGSNINNTGHNFVISITPDGNTMLVGNTYKADGSPKGNGVSISVKRNGQWSLPVEQKIIDFVNVNDYCNFFLTNDGSRLIMSIDNRNTLGEKDFFISFLNADNTWSKPQHMGNVINSFGNDFSPFLAADGKTLFFASDGRAGYGSSDVFMSKRLDDTWLTWSEPKNLGPEINTSGWEAYYCIPAKGNYAYMVMHGAADGMGSDDVYRIKVAEDIMPDPVVMVKGKVYNKKTNEVIEADISYESLENADNNGRAYSGKEGFALALPRGSWYGFQAKAQGFISVSENIDLKDLAEYAEKEINLYLVPIEKGQVVRLNNIFFDFGKATLRSESNKELDRLVRIMTENGEMKIEIGGHTDDKGSDAFNLQLSNDRARAVADYIMGKGITSDRVSFKGYGESRPVASNDTEEGTQLNRRVEFTIR